MSLQGTVKRYMLITQKLEERRFPTFLDLKQMLEDQGFGASDRTVQRDLEQIRGEFGIDIKYDKAHNGYYIDKSNTPNLESFIRFLEVISTSDLLIDTLKDGKDSLKFVSFETEGNLKGVEHLKLILRAIKEQNRITFKHFNFHTSELKSFVLEPYLLKQYQSRWYVCGKLKGRPFIIVFGIDRMEEVQLQLEPFTRDNNFDAEQYFSSVVGINGAEGKREEVVFSVTYPTAHYFKTLKLHPSQEILADDDNKAVFQILVVPNVELVQKLLAQGEAISVIGPGSLVQEMKEHCALMLKNYS